MKYMLDTNIIAYLKKNTPQSVRIRFLEEDPMDMCVSTIVLAELEYGIQKSSKREENEKTLMLMLAEIPILPFDVNAAREYGEIRAHLQSIGKPIGSVDYLIAAHARSLGLTLVTNNTKEFDRVPGLKVENWV